MAGKVPGLKAGVIRSHVERKVDEDVEFFRKTFTSLTLYYLLFQGGMRSVLILEVRQEYSSTFWIIKSYMCQVNKGCGVMEDMGITMLK